MKKIIYKNSRQSKVIPNLLFSFCLTVLILLTTNAFAISILNDMTSSISVSEGQGLATSEINVPPSGNEFSSRVGTIDPLNILGNKIAYDISGNADPFLSFTLSVTDSGDPSTFGFSLSMPITPLNAPVDWTDSLSATLTDGTTTPVELTVSSGNLVDFLIKGTIVTGLGGSLSGSGTYPAISSSGTYSGGTPPYDMIGLSIAFTGSGNGAQYDILTTWNVAASQSNPSVPEPTALLLLGCGLMGFAAIKRKIDRC